MKRRDFSLQLAAASLGAGFGWAGPASAQGALEEGKEFSRLQTPAPVALPSPQKKIEVIEFFWYGCPHCFAFEPTIETWSRRLPADVYFRQVPFAFIGRLSTRSCFMRWTRSASAKRCSASSSAPSTWTRSA